MGRVPDRNDIHERIKEGDVTYDAYAALDDGARYEVSNGMLELLSAPSPLHQLVIVALRDVLKDSCTEDFLMLWAPVDVILGSKEVRQPDFVAIRQDRIEIVTKRGVEGPPDLVGEVLSPSSIRRDREQKLRAYAKYGIPEYWILSLEYEALEQYSLIGSEYAPPIVYTGEDRIRSTVMACADFSMAALIAQIPHLPNG